MALLWGWEPRIAGLSSEAGGLGRCPIVRGYFTFPARGGLPTTIGSIGLMLPPTTNGGLTGLSADGDSRTPVGGGLIGFVGTEGVTSGGLPMIIGRMGARRPPPMDGGLTGLSAGGNSRTPVGGTLIGPLMGGGSSRSPLTGGLIGLIGREGDTKGGFPPAIGQNGSSIPPPIVGGFTGPPEGGVGNSRTPPLTGGLIG